MRPYIYINFYYCYFSEFMNLLYLFICRILVYIISIIFRNYLRFHYFVSLKWISRLSVEYSYYQILSDKVRTSQTVPSNLLNKYISNWTRLIIQYEPKPNWFGLSIDIKAMCMCVEEILLKWIKPKMYLFI